MFLEKVKSLFYQYTNYNLSDEQKKEVKLKILKSNVKRMRLIAFVSVLAEIALIVFYDLRVIESIFDFSFEIPYQYFLIHLFLAVLSIVFFILSYKIQPKKYDEIKYIYSFLMYGYVLIFLSCLAYITGLDQLTSNQITSFIVYYMIASVLVILPPPRQLWVYGIPTIIFHYSIQYYQSNENFAKINSINGILFAITMIAVSMMFYYNFYYSTAKGILLKEKTNRLEFLANHDSLTGLHNRRKFEDNLYNEKAHENKNLIYGLGILDLDFFKKVNDEYGHDRADDVLLGMGKLLKEKIEKNGFVARWGGEEFIFLIKSQSMESILEQVEDLRASIEKTDFNGIHVTASIGLTRIDRVKLEEIKHSFIIADKALYQSKQNGRNCTTVQ